ncbi:cytochrome b [Saccharibacter sp. 17.LH.SD]|uniref:cytochrome b n=1 Tax=Saccharibacter sp. 17.LH.SD TaxID=2689393 RepID=UPI00137027CB|nr:cytochrome b [Saccharibacter sp. 17.LH.SD]MXV44362.1 cytochrome b [Saccharibacter sp. 17.LH.SD]
MSMPARQANGLTRYTKGAIILHWLVALGIIILIVIGLVMDHLQLNPMRLFQLYQLHKSIGITVMFLIVLRIIWRITHKPPELPASVPPFDRLIAHLAQLGLYGLQIFMPLTGWAMVSVSVLGIPTVLYGTVHWPDLPVLATLPNKAPVEAALKVAHHWGGWILTALILVHAAAALFHHYVLRDNVLRQMLPAFGRKATQQGD